MLQIQMRKAKKALADKTNVMIFTGAGASAPSGIPTFSGNDAVTDWGIQKFRASPKWRREVWDMAFGTYWGVKPNPAHDAIAHFINAGKGMHVTSNVDHLLGGTETCGSIRELHCDDCGKPANLDYTRLRWQGGNKDPRCETCDGIIRPDVVFIGESFDYAVLREYDGLVREMDALVVVGASMLIGMWMPAYDYAINAGLPVVSVNKSKVPWNELADIPLRGDAAKLVPELLDSLHRGS